MTIKRSHSGDAITFDTSQLDSYVRYLRTLKYKDVDREVKPVVRQIANQAKTIMKRHTPVRQKEYVTKKGTVRTVTQGGANKYGAAPGNLKRSMRVYVKRTKAGMYEIGASVGPKLHRRGALLKKQAQGKNITDGYYWFFVNFLRSRNNIAGYGFVNKARKEANRTIDGKLTQRGVRVIERRLQKKLNK